VEGKANALLLRRKDREAIAVGNFRCLVVKTDPDSYNAEKAAEWPTRRQLDAPPTYIMSGSTI
jgi:hypothetical protein